MNVFLDLAGLEGEELASAGLRHLMLRSLPLRVAVLKLLSSRSPVGPLRSESHFSCYRDYPTLDEEMGRGRLDLVIETDDAVLGVASKLHGSFTRGEPLRCRSTLVSMATGLGAIRRRTFRTCAFVVGPRSRGEEIAKELEGLPDTRFVAWEDVLERLERAAGSADPVSREVFHDFEHFVSSSLTFLPDFDETLPHLLASFPDGGSDLQCQFLRRLAEVVPVAGKLIRLPGTCGYYLTRCSATRFPLSWFGFVATRSAGGARAAAFVLARRDAEPAILADARVFRPTREITISIKGPAGYTPAAQHWEIVLGREWGDPARVRHMLAPFLSVEGEGSE